MKLAWLHPLTEGMPSDRIWSDWDDTPFLSSRVRYLVEPTLLLLKALDRLAPEFPGNQRIGLLLDPGEAFQDIQARYYQPVATEGELGASPMLFPQTSSASAAGHAAIHFGLQGPCFVMQGVGLPAWAETAACLLRENQADALVLAAVHWRDRSQRPDPEAADCAAALLIQTPVEATRLIQPCGARLGTAFGHTGPCESFGLLAQDRDTTP